jgi:hypothetical protein
MWQKRQAELLKGEIKAILASLSDVDGLSITIIYDPPLTTDIDPPG